MNSLQRPCTASGDSHMAFSSAQQTASFGDVMSCYMVQSLPWDHLWTAVGDGRRRGLQWGTAATQILELYGPTSKKQR